MQEGKLHDMLIFQGVDPILGKERKEQQDGHSI